MSPSETLYLRDAIADFLAYLKNRKGRSQTTIDTYGYVLHNFLLTVGNIDVRDITIHTIEIYAQELDKKQYKSKTFRNKMVPVRCLIAHLYKFDQCSLKPEMIDLPQSESPEANFLDEREQRRFIRVIKNPRDRAMMLILLTSGLRVSEVINLRIEDVYERSVVVRKGKGNKSRLTFMSLRAHKAMEDHLRASGLKRGWLFPNPDGNPISRVWVARRVSMYAVMAGIDKQVSPHTLRHSFATTMLKRGANIETVQKIMGHVNIRTTRIYLHFTNDDLRRAYNKAMS